MFKLRINNELTVPAVFALARRLENLEMEISPEVEGFELLDSEGVQISAGESRKDLMKAVRELLRPR